MQLLMCWSNLMLGFFSFRESCKVCEDNATSLCYP
jgi:hypothetical protein